MRYRQTFAKVDLSAIRHNIQEHKKYIPKDAEILAVVKADGYGHGAIPVLKAAIKAGVRRGAVALVEEAIELRNAGIDIPIILVGGWYPEAMPAFKPYNITPTIYSPRVAAELNRFCREQQSPQTVHIKLDTGMGRIGFNEEELTTFLASDKNYDFLNIDGVLSHFSSADEGDLTYTHFQLEKFDRLLNIIKSKFDPTWIHIANSAGTSQVTRERGNLFRLGIAMYGQPPSLDIQKPVNLKEAISWKTAIAHLQRHPENSPISYGRTFYTRKESVIATLCLGYADGYFRLLSNKGYVLVRGQRAPVVGRVCMDMTMIDVTHIPDVALWDEVVLIGRQGDEYISATETAEWVGTINYEITCNISKRVPRMYVEE